VLNQNQIAVGTIKGRLQEKLARHGIAISIRWPSPDWPRRWGGFMVAMEKRTQKRALRSSFGMQSPPSCAGPISVSRPACKSLATPVAPFCFGHKGNKKSYHSGPNVLNDNPKPYQKYEHSRLRSPERTEKAPLRKKKKCGSVPSGCFPGALGRFPESISPPS